MGCLSLKDPEQKQALREEKRKKKRLASGILQRWLRNILSLMSVIVILLGAAFSVANGFYTYSTMRSGLEAEANTTAAFLRNYLNLDYSECYDSCVQLVQNYAGRDRLELQFVGGKGEVLASSYGMFAEETVRTSEVSKALETKTNVVFVGENPSTRERIMSVATPMIYADGQVVGVLRFVTSTRNADRLILVGMLLAIGFAAFAIFLVYVSNRMYLRSILMPVAEITDTAKRIASGSYGVRIQKKFDDEIGELADTINDMSAKIGQAERMQSEFVSSVSHELRTPLTAITGWGETLLQGDADPEETRRGISIILGEAKRLTSMVEELLEFTRIQDGRFTLNVRNCDLRADFEDMIYMYGSRLRQEGIRLEYNASDDEIPEISCDPERMRQVFLNILDNAAKHGGEGRRIMVSMQLEGDRIVTRIRDFGPGIPEEELPHVKMKFYKGSSKARGSGIGLAVCDQIVELHGGTLTLENAEGGGCLVTVSLPVTQ
ncbi:MAG: HAMP domain-containing histidine kinase [Oscillospiraceae bacterium]|nr:HAMP domain-containing histidine kinase [Oscillospiraceae bacterium]